MGNKKADVQVVGTVDNHADPFTKLMPGSALGRWVKANMATTED